MGLGQATIAKQFCITRHKQKDFFRLLIFSPWVYLGQSKFMVPEKSNIFPKKIQNEEGQSSISCELALTPDLQPPAYARSPGPGRRDGRANAQSHIPKKKRPKLLLWPQALQRPAEAGG